MTWEKFNATFVSVRLKYNRSHFQYLVKGEVYYVLSIVKNKKVEKKLFF